MREIKFRAWDDDKKQLTPVKMVEWSASLHSFQAMDIDDETSSRTPVGNKKMNNMIVEQYTGVKDLNGQEVYEGDILIDPDDNRVYGVVTFYDGVFSANGGYLYDEADGTYVGGNIHENPELLGGE